MSEATRRVFLSTSAVGAAAVGVAAVTPTLSAVAGSTENAESAAGRASGSLLAFVGDVSAGEVSLMVGEQEVVVHDRELVSRLLRALAG